MNNDIDYQEHEVVTNDAQLIQMLNKQLVEVLGQLREKEEECSELIEFINLKNEHLLEQAQKLAERDDECNELIEVLMFKNEHIRDLKAASKGIQV